MRDRRSVLPGLAVIMGLAVLPAQAAMENVTIRDGWIRALPPAVPSGGYFTLHNDGKAPVTLTGAQSPACGMLMLHKSENHGGMGSMADVETVEVPAGGTLAFAPGGYHLMCMQAGAAVTPGNHVPVTLTFKNGGRLTSQFAVRNAAGK